MSRSYSLRNTQIITLACLLVCSVFNGENASAQLIPDSTLGTESSVVIPLDPLVNQVQGGALRGGNLFHSFSEFNVGAGKSVYFANPTAVTNILTRVTGVNSSYIFGTLGVNGDANLVLINPNGINFGPDASLDLRGSFTATTADGIKLGENAFFSATDTENSSLLSIQPGALFSNAVQNYQGNINQAGDLAVNPGENLTLLANWVKVTGSLTAPGGKVEVLGDRISLIENANIDVSSPSGGGTVLVGGEFQGKGETPTAYQTFVGEDVTINTDATVNGDGGEVIVWADKITAFYGDISALGGTEGGDGGFVEVSGKESLIYRGEVDTSSITGSIGTLLLDPNDIVIKTGTADGDDNGNDAQYFGNNASGDNGQILATDNIPTILYESELENQAKNTNITLQANNNITLEDLADDELNLSGSPDSIVFTADADGDGTGDFEMEDTTDSIVTGTRDITISGANLTLGNINTDSYSSSGDAGEGGDITLDASGNIEVKGNLMSRSYGRNSAGKGGLIDLDADGNIEVTGNLRSDSYAYYNNASEGGAITLDSGGYTTVTGNLNSRSYGGDNSNKGGKIELNADGNIEVTGNLNSNSYAYYNNANEGGAITLDSGGDITVTGNLNSDSFAFYGDPGEGGAIALDAGSDITLNSGFDIRSEGSLGGTISLHSGGNIEALDGFIVSSNYGQVPNTQGGNIIVIAQSLFLKDGSQLGTRTFGQANAGKVLINTTNSVVVDSGINNSSFSGIFSEVQGSNGGGNALGIEINTVNLKVLQGAQVSASTFSEGNAGLVKINATDSILLAGESAQGFVSGIFSQVLATGKGDSGGMEITTGSLEIQDGGLIGASTFGEGNAGLVKINATDSLLLAGESAQGFLSGIFSSVETTGRGDSRGIEITTGSLEIQDGGRISTSTFGEGNAGEINITTQRFSATSGSQLTSSTDNNFDAGDIILFVTEDITLAGENTGLFANTTPNSSGNSGNIFIDPITMTIRDGAQVAVNSQGSGLGGNITLFAGDLNLFNQGTITAATASTSGGNITLNVPGIVLMRHNSLISAAAGGIGDGGNINLNVGFIVAVPKENSDVIARSSQGRGGDIVINADGVYGFVTNSRFLTPFSDLNASSDVVGNEGNVAVNVQFDATQGLNQLPASLVDAESLVDKNACKIESDKIAGGSAFVVTGRGGLLASPLESLTGFNSLVEWASLENSVGNINATIIEEATTYEQAQGWEMSPDGEVILTATATEATHHQGGMQHPGCQGK